MHPALRRLVVHQERLIETWKVCDTTGSVWLNPTARNGSKLLSDARWLCPNGCTTSWGTCLTSEKLICFSKTVPGTSTMAIMWLMKALSSLVTLCRARIIRQPSAVTEWLCLPLSKHRIWNVLYEICVVSAHLCCNTRASSSCLRTAERIRCHREASCWYGFRTHWFNCVACPCHRGHKHWVALLSAPCRSSPTEHRYI
jgi:hypothetical protein